MKPHLSDRLRYFDARIGSPIAVEAADRLEALERENAELRAEVGKVMKQGFDRCAEITARAEAAERRNAELEADKARLSEALEPFAKYLDMASFDLDNKGSPLPDDQGMGWVYLTIADFRRARAALAGSGGGWPVPEGIPDPDLLAMANGVISLHYEDLGKAQTAFDHIEALAAQEGG